MEEYIEILRKEFYSNIWEDCKLCQFAVTQSEPIVGFVWYPKRMVAIINNERVEL